MASEFTYNGAITVAQDAEVEGFIGRLSSARQAAVAAAATLVDQTTPFDVANDAEYAKFITASLNEIAYIKNIKK